MGDATDTVTTQLSSYRSRAGRYAVAPLYGKPLNSPEAAVEMLAVLRRRWIGLLNRLGRANWDRAKDEPKRVFLAGCPPFGVSGDAKPRQPCHRSMLCPFCYARDYAINAYDRLLWATEMPPKEVTFFTTVHTHTVSIGRGARAMSLAVRDVKEFVIEKENRRREVDGFNKVLGAIVFHRVRPQIALNPMVDLDPTGTHLRKDWDGFKPSGYKVIRSAIVAAKPGATVPVLAGTSIERLDGPTKKDLASLIGRLFAYPTEMYSTYSASTIALVQFLAQARAFASHGACRNKTEESET